ncbi:phosphodiester glycosidase family protein [Candidatus Daviesbacteria bacterium]|nr:phosphodiester glycosidase family protein [Candidatus Daviesbacteria bacterium]
MKHFPPFKILRTKFLIILVVFFILLSGGFLYKTNQLEVIYQKISNDDTKLRKDLFAIQKELLELKSQDQYKINQDLKKEVDNIQKTYDSAVVTYEKMLDFSGDKTKKAEFEKSFAKSLKLLSGRNYSEAGKILADVKSSIEKENQKAAAAFKIPENVPQNNTPPSSGFSQQKVHIDNRDFLVNIVSADLNSTKVIVDTASDGDCRDNCPVLPLADFVSRSGAFAGINGSFFCPSSYPSCTGKTNSFDTLLMNKNKTYFNSDNNVYSNVPAVIFSGGSARFVTQSLQWGRDTSVDSVLANYPLYVLNGEVQFSANGDPKIDSKGTRTFVGTTGSTVYIGLVYNASAGETAQVLKTMGMQNALGLDQGGSTALWFGGYKAGPGRQIPNALLLVKK